MCVCRWDRLGFKDSLRFLFDTYARSAHAPVQTRPSDSNMHPHSLAIYISLRKLHLISLKPSLSRLHTHELFYITSRNLSCCINNMISLSYYILLLHISRIANIRLSCKFRCHPHPYTGITYIPRFILLINIRRKSCIFVRYKISRISATMPQRISCLIRYTAFFCYEIHIASECVCMSELEERVCTGAQADQAYVSNKKKAYLSNKKAAAAL